MDMETVIENEMQARKAFLSFVENNREIIYTLFEKCGLGPHKFDDGFDEDKRRKLYFHLTDHLSFEEKTVGGRDFQFNVAMPQEYGRSGGEKFIDEIPGNYFWLKAKEIVEHIRAEVEGLFVAGEARKIIIRDLVELFRTPQMKGLNACHCKKAAPQITELLKTA